MSYRIISSIAVAVIFFHLSLKADNLVVPQKVSDWDNVTGFDINSQGNYMVLSQRVGESELLFESWFDGKLWSVPKPIDLINKLATIGVNIGGPYLYFDESLLLFHANFAGGSGGYDIYYSKKQSGSWGEPQRFEEPINSVNDERYASLPAGSRNIYFSRSNPNPDLKKPSKAPACETFYVASKNNSVRWNTPVPMHDIINKGCQFDLYVCDDGKTIFYSSVDQENSSDGYNIYWAREYIPGSWLLPVKIDGTVTDATEYNPRVVGNNIYYIVQTESRKGITGSIFTIPLPDQNKPLNTVTSNGKVVQLENQKPIAASLKVFDPITLNIIGEFTSDANTGEFSLKVPDKANYIVDLRNEGLSFASFQLDYRDQDKKNGPDVIELFNTITLDLSVFDSEIFKPLDAEVWAESKPDNKKITGTRNENGTFSLALPIGHIYKIGAVAKGFDENSFEFNLCGDIIFSRFERDMPLVPRKKAFEVQISDAETDQLVNAEVTFKNLNRDEVISVAAVEEPKPDAKQDDIFNQAINDPNLMNIPFTNSPNPFRFALIIGNEDYKSYQVDLQSESNVDYAMRDATLFKEYAMKVLGVPAENILFNTNARAIEMRREIKKINNIIKTMNGNAEVYFYYAGHGFPDEQTHEPYIIPVDVSGTTLEFGIKLTELYAKLTEFPSKRVTVFLDACFSGGARNVGLVSARGVKIKPKASQLGGNLVVFSATNENQTAHPYRDMKQGLFTYYALKKLRETKGDISYKDYAAYLDETVNIKSILINNTEQSPQTNVSPAAKDTWEKWDFK